MKIPMNCCQKQGDEGQIHYNGVTAGQSLAQDVSLLLFLPLCRTESKTFEVEGPIRLSPSRQHRSDPWRGSALVQQRALPRFPEEQQL